MQWQQVAHGLITCVVPFFIAKWYVNRQQNGVFALLLAIISSAALTFAAWMLMRIYIGRRGDSLGLAFNFEISAPWWIASAIIATLSYGVLSYMKRKSKCIG